jgi:integrase
MTTDRHLEHHADGSWTLLFPGEHTKNGRPLDLPLDAETSRMLTAYLELARSRFRGAGSTDRVWLGMRGAMTRSAIRGIVERHTFDWYGEAHGPHDFRKWLRASAARRSPELAMDSADVMGHSAEVSVQYYAEASCLHAALRHGDRIAERRARLAGRAERALAAELERWEEGYR